jgi:arginine N-succinyltransferase
MYVIRQVEEKDLDTLFELSKLVYFINLPSDKSIIEKRIKRSIDTFHAENKDFWKCLYIFVLEDITTRKVLGVSMIHAQHGTEEEPHFFLKVDKEEKFSSTINTGFVHGTLKLAMDTDGPTEIGGLVLHPDSRGNDQKLGKQLSFARFLFMAMHKNKFKPTVISELMPPLDNDDNSPLWEAIGRRFMNMDYKEADVLSRTNKSFILNLYPSNNIYQTLLPVEARNSIGRVGKETAPVRRMLESIGFKYANEVDPFDGGPHFKCETNDIKLIKEFDSATLKSADSTEGFSEYLISIQRSDKNFTCFKAKANFEYGHCFLDSKLVHQMELKVGSIVSAIPF